MTKKNKSVLISAVAIAVTVSGCVLLLNNSSNFGNASSMQNNMEQTSSLEEKSGQIVNLSNMNSNQEISVRELEIAPEITDIRKDTIYHMMLNSIDYYDKASGTMVFSSDTIDVVNAVEFQTVLSQSTSYSRFSQHVVDDTAEMDISNLKDPEFENIVFCSDGEMIDVFPNEKTYQYVDSSAIFTLADAVPISDADRISIDKDGILTYRYRSDPTNVSMSSMCLFPQAFAFGFLSDQSLWDIVGTVECGNIVCYNIQGKTTSDYGTKLNVTTFNFLVDSKTGVLVKYEGFDKNGNLSDFMYTENLKFDDFAETVNEFSENIVSNYSEVK